MLLQIGPFITLGSTEMLFQMGSFKHLGPVTKLVPSTNALIVLFGQRKEKGDSENCLSFVTMGFEVF